MAANRAATPFVALVCACGLAAILAALAGLPDGLSWSYALTCAVSVVAAQYPLRLRWGHGGSSVSAVTAGVFFSILQFGTAATVPLAALAACSASLVLTPRRDQALRLAFNVSAVVLAVAAAGLTVDAARGQAPAMMAVAAVAGAVVYFVVNSLLVAGAVTLDTGGRWLGYWQQNCLVTAPYFMVCAAAGGLAATLIHEPADVLAAGAVAVPVYLTYRSYASYVAQLEDRSRAAEEASALNLRIAESLTLAITAPDGTTYRDLRDQQDHGRRVGERLGLGEPQQRALALAVLLRDIGLLAVPREMRAPRVVESLTQIERFRSHPQLGADMLAGAGLPEGVLPAISHHHEHWDGSGYPHGLSGERIPIEARIVGAVDFLAELLHSHDNTRRPCTLAEALARVRGESGRRLDPRVAAAVVEVATPAVAEPGAEAPAEPLTQADRRTGVFEQVSAVQREARVLDDLARSLQEPAGLDAILDAATSNLALLLPVERMAFQATSGTGAPSIAVGDARPAPQPADGVPAQACHLDFPLQHEGSPIGALTIQLRGPAERVAGHADFLRRVVSLLEPRVAALCLLDAAQRQASTDTLTGLPNRRSFELRAAEELARSARTDLPLTLLLIDLDGFKRLNDTCGHAYGDIALVATADALRGAIRPCDAAARLGGDEFVVVLPGCDAEQAEPRRREVQDRLCRLGVETPAGPAALGASIGSASWPGDGRSLEQLLAVADARMYEDKQRRRRAA